MPGSSGQLLDQLAVAAEQRSFADLEPSVALATGAALPKPEGVFPRYQEDAA